MLSVTVTRLPESRLPCFCGAWASSSSLSKLWLLLTVAVAVAVEGLATMVVSVLVVGGVGRCDVVDSFVSFIGSINGDLLPELLHPAHHSHYPRSQSAVKRMRSKVEKSSVVIPCPMANVLFLFLELHIPFRVCQEKSAPFLFHVLRARIGFVTTMACVY